MGGIGSGNWHRWNSKTTINSTNCIDIRYMRKRGFLQPNTHGRLSWSRGGEPNGNINFVTHDDYLQLAIERSFAESFTNPLMIR